MTDTARPLFQSDTTATGQLAVDSSAVPVRQPDPAALDAFRGQPAYDYDRTLPTGGEGLWDWIIRWLTETILQPIFGTDGAGWVTGGLFFLVVFGVFVAGMYQLLQMRPRSPVEARGSTDGSVSGAAIEAASSDTDLDQLVAEAVEEGNFRRAVRLLYLRTLRRLADAGTVDLDAEKTNRDYVRELRGTDVHDAFRDATRIFEYVWYGHVEVDAEQFRDLRSYYDAIDPEG